MVKPSDFSRAMVWPICWMMTGANPSVGSSSIRKRAPVRRMRAIASICCSPPDSLVPWLLSRSFRLGNSSKIWSSDRPPSRTIGGSSRFSRTSRLAKMPRSSGQNATPMRAILSDDAREISWPPKRIEPVRLPMMPITDFSVVVLPAPLRPSSVTTSPAFTLKLMPCRIWDSPYQASRFSTASTGVRPTAVTARSAISASAMTCPQIGFLDALVLGQFGIIAFGEHLAAGQHGDDVGEIGDDAQIVLDHQDGVFRGDALDQCSDLVDVFMAHAGHRLVKQHHLRIERQRGRDLQRAFAAIAHFDRRRVLEFAEAHVVEEVAGAAVVLVEHRLGAPEIERLSVLALQRDPHILQRGEMRKHRGNLERAHQAKPRHIGRRHGGDVLSLVEDLARRRFEEFGQQVEARRLAGPVRTDQRVNAATADPQVDIADGEEARELLGQSVCFKNELIGQSSVPHQPATNVPIGAWPSSLNCRSRN